MNGGKLAGPACAGRRAYTTGMNSKQPLYLVIYDIASAYRLRKALSVVRDYSTGGQKSVFECYLSRHHLHRLRTLLGQVADPQEDRIAIVRISDPMRVRVLGRAVRPENPGYFYIG